MHSLVVVTVYFLIALVGYFSPGPTAKDMEMFEWTKNHVEMGLSQTKGFNVSTKWGVSPSNVRIGEHNVYVSAPPLHILFSSIFYLGSGGNWRSLRFASIVMGLLYLYGCYLVSRKFLSGPSQIWTMYFALSPMILMYSTYMGTDVSNIGLLVLSYYSLTNYLDTRSWKWMAFSAILYLLGFWNSYIALSVVPPFVGQILLNRSSGYRSKLAGVAFWVVIATLGIAISLIHLSFLPGALEWATSRAVARFDGSIDGGSGAAIAPGSLAMRQAVRIATHYTPVCLILAAFGLVVAMRNLFVPRGRPIAEHRKVVEVSLVLLQFGTWGIPFAFLAMNLAYIHPFSVYYFAPFFAFGSSYGLQEVMARFGNSKTKAVAVTGILVVFLSMSVTRALFRFSGGSLAAEFGKYLPHEITTGLDRNDSGQGPIVIPKEAW